MPTGAARDDFELVLDEESVINPVLLYKFRTDFRLDIAADPLEDLVGESPLTPNLYTSGCGNLPEAYRDSR